MFRTLRANLESGHATYAAGLAAMLVLGLAIGNAHTTNDALAGSEQYFVHKYCPKVAAKAGEGAAKKQFERDARDWAF